MGMGVKDGLARAWAEDLALRWQGQQVYPKRRDATAVLPFTVVVVKRLQQTTPGSDVWLAEVRIVHVSDVADSGSGAHAARVEALRCKIEETYHRAIDHKNGVILYGFSIDEVQDAEGADAAGNKVFSDVFLITAGVGGAG